MRLKLILFVLPILLITNSCDVFNSNSDSTEVWMLQSELSDDVYANDVVEVNNRIFIFGKASVSGAERHDDFYLAEINPKGEMLWEKRFGTDNDEIAKAIIETSDGHLLLVGGTQPNRQMFVIKVDYNGNVAWKNTYDFDPDKVGFGDNVGETVTEVNGGYVVGGSGSVSERNQGFGVPALTKIAPDGTKIWSKTATRSFAGGGILGLQSYKNGSQFLATGFLYDSDFIIYDAQTADTVQIINQNDNDNYRGLVKAENEYITTNAGRYGLELLGISTDLDSIFRYTGGQDERYSAINIDSFGSTVVTTGEVTDNEFNYRNIFAVKSSASLSTIWTFYHESDKRQRAVGAYRLSGGGTGIVGNEFEGDQTHIILLQVDKNGQLIPF